jgi:hypothetical protein
MIAEAKAKLAEARSRLALAEREVNEARAAHRNAFRVALAALCTEYGYELGVDEDGIVLDERAPNARPFDCRGYAGMKTITIGGKRLFVYLIEYGKYEIEDSFVFAHAEELNEDEIRHRHAGGVVTSMPRPFPKPFQLEALGFVPIEFVRVYAGEYL